MNNCLEQKRKEKGYTQEKLSLISKVSRTTISAIEKGRLKYIQSNTMLKLAVALNLDVGEIFFADVVMRTQQNIKN